MRSLIAPMLRSLAFRSQCLSVDKAHAVDVDAEQVFAPSAAFARNIRPCLLIAINRFF